MTTLKSNVIEPSTGTNLSLGAAGDLIEVSNDALQLNTWKDSGGNTLFTSDGSGNLSSINSALDIGGGPKLLQTQAVTDTASVSFTSYLDDTYDHYMIMWTDVRPATDSANFTFQGSTDSGVSYNTTMQTSMTRCYHLDGGQNSANFLYDTGSDQANGTAFQKLAEELENGYVQNDQAYPRPGASGIMHLYDPSQTIYVKQFYAQMQNYYAGSGTNSLFLAGYFNTTSPINALQFKMSSGNITNAKIKLYGIR